MCSILRNFILDTLTAIGKKIYSLEYTTKNIKGKDVVIPRHLKLLELYGYGFNKFNFFKLSFFTALQLFTLYGEFYNTYLKWGTLDMFNSLASGVYGCRYLFITIFLIRNEKLFREMLATFAHEIWVSDSNDFEVNASIEKSLRINRLVAYSAIPLMTLYISGPLYQVFIHSDGSLEFALGVDYPFDVRNEKWTFLLCMTVTNLALYVRGTSIANVNILLSYLLSYTSCRLHQQSEILLLKNGIGVADDDDFKYKLRVASVVKKHNLLISFSDTLQTIFGAFVFVQFSTDAYSICSLGISIMLMQSFNDSKVFFGPMMFIFLSQYVNCTSGERLIKASEELGEAAYNSDWTGKSPKINASLKLIMLRAQYPLKITGIGFFDLSMETLATVMKRTLSYFMLLRTFFD